MRDAAKTLSSRLGASRRGVSNEIFSLLLQEITSGDMPGGARLPPERELAEHFGVSQPTVREAIRALDAMGLVSVRHGSGAYVTGEAGTLLNMALSTLVHLQAVSILDLLEIRTILGSYSARRTAKHATAEEVALCLELAGRLEKTQELGSVEEVTAAVVEFQACFSRASHSPFLHGLEKFIIQLMIQLQVASRPRTTRSWREFTSMFIADRAELVSALAERDQDRLAAGMERYLAHQHEVFAHDSDIIAARLSSAGP